MQTEVPSFSKLHGEKYSENQIMKTFFVEKKRSNKE